MSDNKVLSVKAPKRVRETSDYAAFVRRSLRAYSRRVAEGDVEALPEMVAVLAEFEQAVTDAVRGLREFGYSNGEIAARLGVSRQAVQQKYR